MHSQPPWTWTESSLALVVTAMAAVIEMLKMVVNFCNKYKIPIEKISYGYLLAGHNDFWGFDADLWHFYFLCF